MKMTESQKSPRRRGVFAVTPCKWGSAGAGIYRPALGYADVLATAFSHAMTYRPEDPEWEGRDRFLLSHGHYAIAYYAALLEAGIIPEAELETYGSDDSRLPMSGMATYTRGWRCPAARWGRGCLSPSAWRSGCGRNRVRPGSTTPCPMGSWTKGRPGGGDVGGSLWPEQPD